jgi:hypothetical protein
MQHNNLAIGGPFSSASRPGQVAPPRATHLSWASRDGHRSLGQAKHRTGWRHQKHRIIVSAYLVSPLLESVDLLASEVRGGLLPLDVDERGARRPRRPRAVTGSLHATAVRPPSPQPPSSTTLPRRRHPHSPRGHTPRESLSGHRGSCTARQGDSPRLEAA